jgi:hypothetical protein
MRYMRHLVYLAAITSALLASALITAPFPAHAGVNGRATVRVTEPRPLGAHTSVVRAVPVKPHRWTVKSGETLSSIAASAYGNSRLWPALWWINKAQIRNPDLIAEGQVIKLSAWHPDTAWLDHAAASARPAPVLAAPVHHYQVVYRHHHRTYRSYSSGTYHGSGSMERCIIARESGGSSQVMNSSGHYGLYQFSASTWAASGGNPSDFGHASVSEQQQVFRTAVAARGYSDWTPYDGC